MDNFANHNTDYDDAIVALRDALTYFGVADVMRVLERHYYDNEPLDVCIHEQLPRP